MGKSLFVTTDDKSKMKFKTTLTEKRQLVFNLLTIILSRMLVYVITLVVINLYNNIVVNIVVYL